MFEMMDINEIMDIEENLSVEDLEYRIYDVPEGYTISECDEAREAEVAEALSEIFTPEVVARWDDMSIAEKEACLDRYTAELGEILGIGAVDTVVTYDMSENTWGYYLPGDNKVYLNANMVDAPDQLAITLNTASHEVRHGFQEYVIMHPEKYSDIPSDLVLAWEYNNVNYIQCDYDPEGYAMQPVEVDARGFAEGVMDRYLENLSDQMF